MNIFLLNKLVLRVSDSVCRSQIFPEQLRVLLESPPLSFFDKSQNEVFFDKSQKKMVYRFRQTNIKRDCNLTTVIN